MERKQLIVQRTREYFGGHFEEVLRMVLEDRHELYGWEEPAHLRAVLRRATREDGPGEEGAAPPAVADVCKVGRGAGEPDEGRQREALGQLLEVGATGLEKIRESPSSDLSADELLGLETVLLLYARPGLPLRGGDLAAVPAFWKILEGEREDVELTQRAVGRIELVGHPEYDWAGTGFLVGETCLMTTRGVAQVLAERSDAGEWQFRPGVSAWMDYQSDYRRPPSAACRLKGILGCHDRYDLALLEVEPPQHNGGPAPLALAAAPPPEQEGRPVYLISYPARDGRRNEPEEIARIFRDEYNVKRVQPGVLRGRTSFPGVDILRHDCGPLGHSAGGCLLDLESHCVLGLHVSGRYLEDGAAVPLWMLRDDPLLRRHGVIFAESNEEELEVTRNQLERLARSRLWSEARDVIGEFYRRAFGGGE